MSATEQSGTLSPTLRDIVIASLGTRREERNIELKRSEPWEGLRTKIAATCMAMANLRDGGVIVVGVPQKDDESSELGIEEACEQTYNEDTIRGFVNRYASPPIEPRLYALEHDDRRYLVISISEFHESPIVCKKSFDGKGLVRGAFYIRPPGLPRTTRIKEAYEMADLLNLAAEKRARNILATARHIGLELPHDDAERFRLELHEAHIGNDSHVIRISEAPHLRFVARPSDYQGGAIGSLAECRRLVEKCQVRRTGWPFPFVSRQDEQEGVLGNGFASWVDGGEIDEFWRLSMSGQFLFLAVLREALNGTLREQLHRAMQSHLPSGSQAILDDVEGLVGITYLGIRAAQMLEFVSRLAGNTVYESPIRIEMSLHNARGYMLAADWDRAWHGTHVAMQSELSSTREVNPDELVSEFRNIAVDMTVEILQQFGWLEPNRAALLNDQVRYLGYSDS